MLAGKLMTGLPHICHFSGSVRLRGNNGKRKTINLGCEGTFAIAMAMKLFCLEVAHFLKKYKKIQGFCRWWTATFIQGIMDSLGVLPFHNLLASSKEFELDAVWNVFWQVLFPKYLKVSVFQITCNTFNSYSFLLLFWQMDVVYFNKSMKIWS